MHKILVLGALLLSGCFLTRVVDRAFIGVTKRHPTYSNRKAAGVFLIPFTFAVDLVTFPIQALLLVIFGDGFPFYDKKTAVAQATRALEGREEYRQLNAMQKTAVHEELKRLLAAGTLSTDTVLAFTEEGQLFVTQLNAEARNQLFARLQSIPQPTQRQSAQSLVCMR